MTCLADNERQVIYYKRPNLRLLQIYTLEPLLLPFKVDYSQSVVQTAPRRSSSPAIALDPTRPTIAGASVLGPDTIHQVRANVVSHGAHDLFRRSIMGNCLPENTRVRQLLGSFCHRYHVGLLDGYRVVHVTFVHGRAYGSC